MAHVRLDVGEREHLDGERPERVAEIVKADLRQAGTLERLVEAATESPVVHVAADVVDEDEVLVAGEAFPAAEPVESPGRLVDQRHAAYAS